MKQLSWQLKKTKDPLMSDSSAMGTASDGFAVAVMKIIDKLDESDKSDKFENMGLSGVMLQRLKNEIRLNKPTEVQSYCIPSIIKGRDCLAIAPTGSGKTMAFAIPMLHHFSKDPHAVFGLILTPTRELALQIKDQIKLLGGDKLRVSAILGGVDMQLQRSELNEIPHFIVATPGRLADHVDSGGKEVSIIFKYLKYIVYDEADRLFDGQFDESLAVITEILPKSMRTLVFTATKTENVVEIATAMKSKNVFVYDYQCGEKEMPLLQNQNLTQKYILCPPDFKDGYLVEVLRSLNDENPLPQKMRSIIIFLSTCRECRVLSLMLNDMGFKNVMIHSQMKQKERSAALVEFRSSIVEILIATDVVSRGLDIKQVDLVLNYSVPMPTDYVHRVGRTGRGGRMGYSFMFITPRDVPYLHNVESYIREKLTEMKVDEKSVLKILKDATAVRKTADLQIDEADPYEERKRVNRRKKRILKGEDPSDDEEEYKIVPVKNKKTASRLFTGIC